MFPRTRARFQVPMCQSLRSVDQRPTSVASLEDQSLGGQDSLPLRLKGSPANVADCEGTWVAYGTAKSSAPWLSDRLWHVTFLMLGRFGGVPTLLTTICPLPDTHAQQFFLKRVEGLLSMSGSLRTNTLEKQKNRGERQQQK